MTEIQVNTRLGMSGFHLKMLAMITMVIDHMGVILFPQYRWMRYVGRIAFPIFAFLLVEGYIHTCNAYAHIKRMAIFALISEPLFDFAFFGKVVESGHQNIFFTLLLSLILLKMIDLYKDSAMRFVWFAGILCLAEFLACDYGAGGVMTVFVFYMYRKNKLFMALFFAFLHMFCWGAFSVQSYAVLALIPIFFYNGKRGTNIKYMFYVFYPLHLLVLKVLGGMLV